MLLSRRAPKDKNRETSRVIEGYPKAADRASRYSLTPRQPADWRPLATPRVPHDISPNP